MAILAGEHPMAMWLDGDAPVDAPVDALPAEFPDGTPPRQLFSSHPFPGPSSWLSLPTSIAS